MGQLNFNKDVKKKKKKTKLKELFIVSEKSSQAGDAYFQFLWDAAVVCLQNEIEKQPLY